MGLRGLSRGAAAVALLLTVGVGSASAATLTVTTTTDGTTSGDHQCSLREAVAAVDSPGINTDCGTAANAGNTIVLGATTYTLSIHPLGADDNSTGDLDVQGTTGLTITGAEAGTTTISGTDLADRLLRIISGGVTLQNLTLSSGHAPDGADGVSTAFSGTAATPGKRGSDGGAVSSSGSLSLDHVVITNNSAGNGGRGGNGQAGSFPSGASGGNGGRGGGIYNAPAASLTLTDVTMNANRSGNGGAGGAGGSGTSPVGDGAPGGCCGDGGGVYNDHGAVTVTESTLTQNIAGDGGAGGSGGNPITAGGAGAGGTGQGGSSGGAIATAGGTVSIAGSTLAENLSGKGGDGGDGGFNPPSTVGTGGHAGNGSGGGGIFAQGGATVTLMSVTVAQNLPGGPGTPGSGNPNGGTGNPAEAGGIDVNGATVSLQDTLLASNSVGNCGGPTAVTDNGQNLSFGGDGCPSGFATGDPKLGPLQDNGGPTQTMDLGSGSAAIDKGAGCPSPDQRGAARPSGPACDIGAYEVTPPAGTTGPATAITSSGAALNGSITPNQSSATVRFEYGTSTAYGTTTSGQQFGGFSPSPASAQISGLAPNATYHYRVLVTSADGSATGADETFTTGAAPPPPGAGTSAPKLTALSLKPSAFRTAKRKHHGRDKTGTTLTYTDSQASTTTFTVFKCTKIKKRRCIRYTRVGSFAHHDSAGRDRFHWSGTVGRIRLRPGRYRLEGTARTGRLISRLIRANFTVVR